MMFWNEQPSFRRNIFCKNKLFLRKRNIPPNMLYSILYPIIFLFHYLQTKYILNLEHVTMI